MSSNGYKLEPGTRVVVRAIVYYAVLITVTTLVWRFLPRSSNELPSSLDTLFGGGRSAAVRASQSAPLDETTLSITVAVAMLAAVLLSIPVAWVYLLTRAKRGKDLNDGKEFSATQASVFLDGFTFRRFLEDCYSENRRRMGAFDKELLRPSFLPQLAETALGAMRLWSFRSRPLPA